MGAVIHALNLSVTREAGAFTGLKESAFTTAPDTKSITEPLVERKDNAIAHAKSLATAAAVGQRSSV